MKLLLINAYFGGEGSSETDAMTFCPPLGLGYIGTYVRDNTTCEVEIVDPVPQKFSKEDVLRKAATADIVGLSCYTDVRFDCFDFAQAVKRVNPDCKLVVGGPHVFFLDQLILEHYSFVDVVVRGEGEETMKELVSGKPYENIEGITWRDSNNKIVRNSDRELIRNLDDIYVDYSLLPDSSLYAGDIELPTAMRKLRTVYMIESRGCPSRCIYCANDHWKRRFRTVSPERTVEKMEHLVKTQGIELFRFCDDLFTASKKRVFAFCNALKEKKLNVKFKIEVRADTAKEVLEALREVGCVSVSIGIESGSDKMLKRIEKGITRKQIIDVIELCRQLEMWVQGYVMVAIPGETMSDFRKTLKVSKLPDILGENIFRVLPGTPFYKELRLDGKIDDGIWFDQNRYKGMIFYWKENFADAPFSKKKAQWLALYAKYYHFLHRPIKLIKHHGFFVGLSMLMVALLDIPLKGYLYRIAFKYKHIYRKFTIR
jgi:radical SAM superfamily enzyme YgiQ (UPF0313 family)